MKSINQILVVFLLSVTFGFSQEITDCKVVGGEVDAVYIGKCKDGFASGMGALTYSNSHGKYLYSGKFKKGKMHGQGQMFLLDGDEKKLLYQGIWKQSIYKGEKKKTERPYKISRNENIDRYSIRKIADGNKVSFEFLQLGAKNNVTNLLVEGDSGTRLGAAFDEKNNAGFEDVEFPFKCLVTYTAFNKLRTVNKYVTFEFVINEPGVWDVTFNN